MKHHAPATKHLLTSDEPAMNDSFPSLAITIHHNQHYPSLAYHKPIIKHVCPSFEAKVRPSKCIKGSTHE